MSSGDYVEIDIEVVRRLVTEAVKPYVETIDRLELDMWRGRGKHNPSVVDRLSCLESDMNVVKEGVANFRKFQMRGNAFFDAAEAVWKADGKRRIRNLAIWLAILAAATPGIWMGVEWLSGIVSTLRDVQHIEEQWKAAHPAEFVAPQQMFNDRDQQNARNQNADGEPLFQENSLH